MQLRSTAYESDGQFPVKYSKDGENVSPPYSWDGAPEETRELVFIMENITPSTNPPFVQWLVYKIPPDVKKLPEGLQHTREPQEPEDVLQGKNSWGNVGYDGPVGTISKKVRMKSSVFALDKAVETPPEETDRKKLMDQIRGHIIDSAEVVADYMRPE